MDITAQQESEIRLSPVIMLLLWEGVPFFEPMLVFGDHGPA